MTPELLNKLKHLANIAAHLPSDVTLEDEDAAMKALHGELAADTVLQMIALAEGALLAAAPAPIQKEPVGYVSQSATSLLMEYRGEGLKTSMRIYSHPEPEREITVPLYAEALAGSQVQAAGDAVQCTLGVGSGNGNLFVVGDYNSIKAAQAWILRAEKAESRLAEIQRGVEGLTRYGKGWGGTDQDDEGTFIDRAATLALFQPQGQADTSGLPG